MTQRKRFESWLEEDCDKLPNANLDLLESNSTSYIWRLSVDTTNYEINYSDLGYITLSSLPKSGQLISEVREIYQGDISEQSYSNMIELLADNLTDHWI